MISQFEKFKKLHQQKEALLVGNVWDVQSALLYQQLNFKAIGTSSAAISKTLGFEDGENMCFEDYIYIIKSIIKNIYIPLSVDLEAGYGKNSMEIVENMEELYKLGVVGINIEDSKVIDDHRELEEANIFFSQLNSITSELKNKGIEMFINVRIDTFLLNTPDTLKETLQRILLYQKADIHGLFLPCISDVEDIKTVCRSISLPINVMCVPHLPNFKTLFDLGVKRISMGNSLNEYIYKIMTDKMKEIISMNSFQSIF